MEERRAQEIEDEFAVLSRIAGITLLADRKDGVLSAYQSLKDMANIVRAGLGPGHEPSNVYRLTTITRAK